MILVQIAKCSAFWAVQVPGCIQHTVGCFPAPGNKRVLGKISFRWKKHSLEKNRSNRWCSVSEKITTQRITGNGVTYEMWMGENICVRKKKTNLVEYLMFKKWFASLYCSMDLWIVLWQAVLTSLWHPNQIVYWMNPTTGRVHWPLHFQLFKIKLGSSTLEMCKATEWKPCLHHSCSRVYSWPLLSAAPSAGSCCNTGKPSTPNGLVFPILRSSRYPFGLCLLCKQPLC